MLADLQIYFKFQTHDLFLHKFLFVLPTTSDSDSCNFYVKQSNTVVTVSSDQTVQRAHIFVFELLSPIWGFGEKLFFISLLDSQPMMASARNAALADLAGARGHTSELCPDAGVGR